MGYNRHFVLCQRSRLIRTYHGSSSHSLASMKFSDQVVFFQHFPHTESQTHGDTHWQTFGNSHHNQCDCQHHRAQCKLRYLQPRMVISRITIEKKEIHHTPYHDQYGYDETQLGDGTPQAVQLLVQRRFDFFPLMGFGYTLTLYGVHADFVNMENSGTSYDGGSP